MNLSTNANTPEENGSSEDTFDAPGPNTVVTPDPGNKLRDSGLARFGRFELRDPDPTVARGWDVIGRWILSETDGIVILEIGVAPSRLVADGVPLGHVRLRASDEVPTAGVRSTDLSRIRLDEVRSVIHSEIAQRLDDPFYQLTDDLKPGDPAFEGVADMRAVAESRKPRGRPAMSDTDLDQWARDAMEAVRDSGTPIYKALEDKWWPITQHTVKNHRLPRLKKTGRIVGNGRQMFEGPNYPLDEEDDDG